MTMTHNADAFQFLGGESTVQKNAWRKLRRYASINRINDPRYYVISKDNIGLKEAVNTALALSKPLLLTGEPGVGKTDLAGRLCYELGLGDKPLHFQSKSTSEASDLIYEVDYLARMHAAYKSQYSDVQKTDEPNSSLRFSRFLQFNALGLAILRAQDEAFLRNNDLWQHAWCPTDQKLPNYEQRSPSVVLIDEIDKAHLDFPNDLLHELDRLSFRIKELDLEVGIDSTSDDKEARHVEPVVIITSNEGKTLPAPFLRRCVYFNMTFPNEDTLNQIIRNRLVEGIVVDKHFRDDYLQMFIQLRNAKILKRNPSIGELLNWLARIMDAQHPVKPTDPRFISISISTLAKQTDDQLKLKAWLESYVR